MSHSQRPRPWYCLDALVEDYIVVLESGGSLKMLKTLKVLRSIIVNLGIIGVTLYTLIATSADATLVSTVSLITLGAYNGVEVADYAALAQAFAEVKSQQDSQDQND